MVSVDELSLRFFMDVPLAGWANLSLVCFSESPMLLLEGEMELCWELEACSGGCELAGAVWEGVLRVEGRFIAESLLVEGCAVGMAVLNVSGVKLGWILGHW